MTSYTLPDGREVKISDELTKRADWIDFTLANGDIVIAFRSDVYKKIKG